MKEKIGILIGLIIAALVIITFGVYALNIELLDGTEFVMVAIPIILVVAALYVLWDRVKNIRKGLPVKDERLILTNYKAGYFGFITAI